MSPSRGNLNLEEIRLRQGNEACAKILKDAAKRSRMAAAKLLNHNSMSYPCLFALLPAIQELGLQQQMLTKYAVSMDISREILEEDYTPRKSYLKTKGETSQQALQWMLTTGYQEENPPRAYQKVMDISVSVLIHLYQDTSILPMVADTIFARRKRGENVHDLIWAYFRSHSPQALYLMAEKLPNADAGEAEFIYDLLGIAHTEKTDPKIEHSKYMAWLEENQSNLVFNEENKQFTSRPTVCPMKKSRQEEHHL